MFLGSQYGSLFFNAMDGVYAGNAGAFSGGCIYDRHPEKRNTAHMKHPATCRKCRPLAPAVIPAKAGIHFDLALSPIGRRATLDSRFRGNDVNYVV
jgi:hypothetical protein